VVGESRQMAEKIATEDKTVKVLKSLANPTRLGMVRRLKICHNAEESCGELSAKIMLSQPTLSHHFNRLIEAGVIIETKFGTQKNYTLNRKLLADVGIDYKKI